MLIFSHQDMKAVKSSGNPMEFNKTLSLGAQSVDWMRSKGDFSRDIARLAKYWLQTILFDKKVAAIQPAILCVQSKMRVGL